MNHFISSITKKEKNAIFEYAMADLTKNPLIEILLKRHRKLEKENRKLQKTIVAICNNFSLSSTTTRDESSNTDDEELVILEPNESNENIVYTIEDEDSEVKIIKMEPGHEEPYDDALLKMKEATDELLETARRAVLSSEKSVKTSQQILADIQAISDDEEEEEEDEEDDAEEEEEEEEEVVEIEEEEEAEEVVEIEEEAEVEEEEEVVEIEEEEEEEVEVEEEEEEVEEEVEVEEEEEEVVEQKEEEEEEGVYEIKIKGTTYYVTNEINSIIYAVDKDGDISIEAGIYKNGKPVFYKK